MTNGTIPEEDSDDLTDDEIASALPTTGSDDTIQRMRGLLGCPLCGARRVVREHALRRRRPNLFWRTTFLCDGGHKERVFFRVNWLGGGRS